MIPLLRMEFRCSTNRRQEWVFIWLATCDFYDPASFVRFLQVFRRAESIRMLCPDAEDRQD
ncbi:hypothetical protein FOMPIDRAFT_1056845 [Fomitopsis schrenkii]|uniref:Uncharacterized protein n=1 Tax=Fomitopsis schrenkii TaxID=2126942 RepID=S8DHK4_FOMSC|nr:hypothetical protein FOMPIDRAFT_1056845 [Fomitopsis schrenkii]